MYNSTEWCASDALQSEEFSNLHIQNTHAIYLSIYVLSIITNYWFCKARKIVLAYMPSKSCMIDGYHRQV